MVMNGEMELDVLRPTLNLTGPQVGPPTIDDLIALAKRLTGRDPTPSEIDKAKQILAHRTQP